jgi:tyrosine-protein kinase Etk/Wzc
MHEDDERIYAANPGARFTLMKIAAMLLARWRWILLSGIGLGTALFLASFLLKIQWQARTTLLPPQQPTSGLSSLLSGSATLAATAGVKNPSDLFVALLNSDSVADLIIKKFDLRSVYHTVLTSDTRRVLAGNTEIKVDSKSGLITVLVTDTDKERAAALANDYLPEYLALSSSLAISEAAQRAAFFERQLNKTKTDLADAEDELRTAQQKSGLIEPAGQTMALITSGSELRAQIAAAEVKLQVLRGYATDENATVQQEKRNLAGLQQQLADLERTSSGDSDTMLLPKGSIPGLALDYYRKLRNVKYNETLFDLYARQLESARIEESRDGAGLQTVDKAVTPDRKFSPHRSYFLIGGFVMGVLGACAWVLAKQDILSAARTLSRRRRLVGA